MKKLKIVFMGTPGFAVGILESILNAGHEVAGVVTVADKPAGRGQKTSVSAVKEFALSNNLRVFQPEKLKDAGFLSDLESLSADVFVVVAFRMLPKEVWQMAPLGTFNLHASLLPQYRGAAPINWAVINGDAKTGVTTFFIDDKIDTGAMILKSETEIGSEETAGELHDRLMEIGGKTVADTLSLIASGEVHPEIQKEEEHLKAAPKLNRENTKIDWSRAGAEIHNLIRGLSPYPSAWSAYVHNGQEVMVKLYRSRFEKGNPAGSIGTITVEKSRVFVSVADGNLEILELQFPGKKKMTAREFCNGFVFPDGAKFE